MLTTHNFKMLNPDVQQPPLCGQLQGNIPKNVLCSKNIKLSNYVWRDPLQFKSDNVNDSLLAGINADFKMTAQIPEYVLRDTQLTDQRMHHMYLNMGSQDTGDMQVAITPAPCDAIFHEIIVRGLDRIDVRLSKQQIEVKHERIGLHGPMAVEHQGTLQVFAMPEFQPRPIQEAVADSKYIVLEFGIHSFNVATGMVGVGLPAITVFGTMMSNYIAKACTAQKDLRFALGIHSSSSRPRNSGMNISGCHSENYLRKANLQAYLIIEPESEDQAEVILQTLNGKLRIAGHDLAHKRVFYTDNLPYAHWMRDIGDEVDEFLALNPHQDALDAMFDFASEDRLCVPVAVGFSQLSSPKIVESENIRQPHCWVETLFKCTELKYGKFQPEYLYQSCSDGASTFYWTQN